MRNRNIILLEIVKQGILNCRLAARHGDAQQAFNESDHVQNLPDLILSADWKVEQYWNVDRAAYIECCQNSVYRAAFSCLWGELHTHLVAELKSAPRKTGEL